METDDLRMKALRVLWDHCETEEQFKEEVEMLGLTDLLAS